MFVKIGQPVDHGFDTPLGLLSDCHRRIERFLSVLLTIARPEREATLGAPERQGLEAALRYFATAAPRHTEDEEASLFPRLRSSGDPQASAALETVARLEADHRVADVHHRAVNTLGRRWLADGVLDAPDRFALRQHLNALHELYRAHIAVEDKELFPAAGRVLSAEDLEAVGREMAARRNVPFARPMPNTVSVER